jgi:hypothetical protein
MTKRGGALCPQTISLDARHSFCELRVKENARIARVRLFVDLKAPRKSKPAKPGNYFSLYACIPWLVFAGGT